jgi:2-keto-3-deoxy-L-arabinonate dehydratase
VLGVAGEIYALTDAERVAVIETAVDQAAGRLPVLAGSSHASGEAAATVAAEAEAAGAEMLLVMPPSFVKPSDAALVDYYGTIADAVGIPLMVQDNPAWTSVTMSISVYKQLAEIERIELAKIEVPYPPAKVREVRNATGDRFTILGGLAGNWLFEELDAGAVGTMPGTIMPDVYAGIWEAWDAGKVDSARAMFDRYHPVIRITSQQSVGFAMLKHLLWRLGVIESPRVRNPLRPLDPADLVAFETVLDSVGLLPAPRGAL